MRFSDSLRACALLTCALLPASAQASSSFPNVVQDALSLSAAPACTLCHAGTPQRGTATTPFATALRSRGLVASDEASLRTALRALEAAAHDSDGDGESDIAELREGSDPNVNPSAPDDVVMPEYGCRAAGAAGALPGLLAAPLGLLLLRRKRR